MPFIENSGGGGGGSGTVTSVTATDTSIVVAGTAVAPTIATGTLDAIAAAHPAAAAWSNNAKKITGLAVASAATDAASLANTLDQFGAPAADVSMGSHKITNLTNGAGAQDAAAFGQIPTALPPNGAAGGVLAGAYPSPTMGKVLDRPQLMRNAEGVITESIPRLFLTGAVAPTSQTVYGVLLGLRAGDSVTGVGIMTSVAASGTSPTTVRVGIADSTGKILALSNNLNASANFPLGSAPLAFASSYVVLADGGYFACLVVNGPWGTTQPSIGKGTTAPVIVNAFNGAAVPHFSWAGQTDLPAVNSSVNLTTALSVPYWLAFYGTPVN